MAEIITSSSNKKLKLVRALQGQRRKRNDENAFIAEGVRLLEEAINSNWPVRFVLYDETLSERGRDLLNVLQHQGQIDIIEISEERMSEISDTQTPQGILAVLEKNSLPVSENPTFLVIADKIRDPGNMGTLLRTANAAGVDAVFITPNSVDPFAPKVIRAGMGAHFHLPIKEYSWEELLIFLKDYPIFMAEMDSELPLWQADFSQPCALLIGGEAFGPSPQGKAAAEFSVTIPMPGGAESLNAAVAGSILITEVIRQRSQSKGI